MGESDLTRFLAAMDPPIALTCKHVRLVTREADGSPVEWPHDAWEVCLTYKGRKHGASYRTGLGHRTWERGHKIDAMRTGNYYSHRHGAYARDLVDASEQGWNRPVAPSLADVVHSLVSDASGADQSFEAWCGDYGYDTDSRKAEATYRECQKTRDALIRLFGRDLYHALLAEEH